MKKPLYLVRAHTSVFPLQGRSYDRSTGINKMSLAAEKRRKAKALKDAGAALSVKLIARSTRGQRIGELQGEDAEADETFWGQGAWQVEDDSDFSTEEGSCYL